MNPCWAWQGWAMSILASKVTAIYALSTHHRFLRSFSVMFFRYVLEISAQRVPSFRWA